MATSLRVTFILATNDTTGMQQEYSADVIVDNPTDAFEQGSEVFDLVLAFEQGILTAAQKS